MMHYRRLETLAGMARRRHILFLTTSGSPVPMLVTNPLHHQHPLPTDSHHMSHRLFALLDPTPSNFLRGLQTM
ncbi:hypothetical protein L227DRAFT_529611 [Lentinus tigrinus ALCF2SS1-6]|uniref:Uncharacterized protein n=1 Tax=Lentinus tigrinus ALCF2SS1-6 TaxID=1328759 RepID=A0A5C2S307_9APHY|nr:hypothetical protein L227DRAFT_529611 [Lentinus tigrinus ALCF2SS1-6]